VTLGRLRSAGAQATVSDSGSSRSPRKNPPQCIQTIVGPLVLVSMFAGRHRRIGTDLCGPSMLSSPTSIVPWRIPRV
jgi:hypothetical protein